MEIFRVVSRFCYLCTEFTFYLWIFFLSLTFRVDRQLFCTKCERGFSLMIEFMGKHVHELTTCIFSAAVLPLTDGGYLAGGGGALALLAGAACAGLGNGEAWRVGSGAPMRVLHSWDCWSDSLFVGRIRGAHIPLSEVLEICLQSPWKAAFWYYDQLARRRSSGEAKIL